MTRSDTYIQEAADRVMITDLVARYSWTADYGTPEGWADLFMPDAVFSIPQAELRIVGHATLIEFMTDLQRTVPHLHHVTTSLNIELDGDWATGKSQLNEFLSQPDKIYPNLHGWYEDEYVFDGSRWRFQTRAVRMPHPENTAVGFIGEYMKDFWTACEKFRG